MLMRLPTSPPTAPPDPAQWGGGRSTWVNGLPQVPLLYAMPKKSQTSIIPAPGGSSARACSGCWEGRLQHCTWASPLPPARVSGTGTGGKVLCPLPGQGLPAKSPARGGHGASVDQELAKLRGGGEGGGRGGLCVHVCVCTRVCVQGSTHGGERGCSMEGWMDGAGLVPSCPPPPVLSALRCLI